MADETPVKVRKAFFITPIGDTSSPERHRSDVVLAHILKPVLVPTYVDEIERADRMADPGEITPAIVNAIVDADLILADLSDANPNVYYELAIAHAFAKPVIHIIEEGQKPRFDVKDVRTFPYGIAVDKADATKTALDDAARIATERGNQHTLVSRAAELKASATSDDPVERQLVEIRELLLDIRNDQDPPTPYEALFVDPQRDLSVPLDDAIAIEVVNVRSALKSASRNSLARWVTEFVARFGHLLDRAAKSGVRNSLLVDLQDHPDLVDGLDRDSLLGAAHYGLEFYVRFGTAGHGERLRPLPRVLR